MLAHRWSTSATEQDDAGGGMLEGSLLKLKGRVAALGGSMKGEMMRGIWERTGWAVCAWGEGQKLS